MTNAQQAAAIRMICQIIIDAVKVGGERGAPGGVLYSALIGKLSINQFESIMRVLVENGNLRKQGHLYHFVKDLILSEAPA